MDEFRTVLNTLDDPGHGVLTDRKSEFLADICHVTSLAEALAVVETMRRRYPKARHVAFAALVGGYDEPVAERMSDDGEPSGTAGKPILDSMRTARLTDCVVSVTRYFGGVLLGSGGLIRAYAGAAVTAIANAKSAHLVEFQEYELDLEYGRLRHLQKIMSDCGGEQIDAVYTDHVALTLGIPNRMSSRFESRIRDAFSAAVTLTPSGRVRRPIADDVALDNGMNDSPS